MSDTSPLISTADLATLFDDPRLKVIDASWHLDGRDARADFETARIPGAVFFDIDAVSDPDTDLPHMLPTPEAFARSMQALGLSDTDTLVVYDTTGLFSAPRAWWMLRHMGARNVRVLDGGLPRWRAEGRDLASGPAVQPLPARFEASVRSNDVADLPMVLAALTGDIQIVDARPAARFNGQTPEPRPGLRGGHMPGAVNLPFKSLLDEQGGLKRGADLARAFSDVGIDPDRPVITSCGSGVTAAVLTLGLAELGRDSILYDGSWAEWGGRTETPVVTT